MEPYLKRLEEDMAINAEMQAIKDEAIKNGTFMKAPNGKPTKLNERQWLQVRTKNFKNWFGDWENDPENASKVVDPETGEPMVVYHGRKSNWGNTFNTNLIYHTSSEAGAGEYAGQRGNVLSEFVNIRKPFIFDFNGSQYHNAPDTSFGAGTDSIARYAKEHGYDGAIFTNVLDGTDFPIDDFVAFTPNQTKSATNNVGTFSEENDNIRYFINPYSLPDGEFTKLESILLTQYGNNEDYGAVVHTANYEYTVNYKGGGEFDIIEYHQIDNNIDNKVYDKERRSTGSYDRLSVRDELAEGECESGSYDVAESEADQYNAGLDTQTREGESEQTKSDAGGQKHQGWRAVKRDSATGRTTFVDESDFESTAEDWEREPDEFFKTSHGEVYGYATAGGAIYLDERIIKPEHPIHEYFVSRRSTAFPFSIYFVIFA